MLVDKEVDIRVNGSNKVWFLNKGYDDVVVGRSLKVKTEDLSHGSNVKVLIKCEYCGTVHTKRYADYYTSLNNYPPIKKYCCKSCVSIKTREIRRHKSSQGLLSIDERGFWADPDNREREFKKYIAKHTYLDRMAENPDGAKLADAIKSYENGGLKGLSVRCGFDVKEIYKNKTSLKEYESLDSIVKKTETFIDEKNHFPSLKNYKVDIGITQASLNQYGGITGIKKYMEYQDEFDLVDDSGFYNSSRYEYTVAQFLLRNNVLFFRECYPFYFKKRRYRSDFTFAVNNIEVHCEIWGYSEKDTSKRATQYTKNKKDKLKLYSKYQVPLIELNYQFFQQNDEDIHDGLERIFTKYGII